MTSQHTSGDPAIADAVASGRWRPGVLDDTIVWRPAPAELLERGAGAPVSLVTAPAGSGKTLLVRSWLDCREPKQLSAWVSVERAERDGQRFWGAVIQALRAAVPADSRIEVRAPTPRFDGEAVVEQLLSALSALREPIVLVVDDLHELVALDVMEQFRFLLDHLPNHVRVVVITRRDLPLGLHRRRLAGELTELRSVDLQFTLEEARALLTASGIVLSEEGLRLLHERTEGWAAGLRFAAFSLATHADPERFVIEFSGSQRTVAEYLVAEVLESQPPPVQRLLVRASLLARVNGELGDLLTGDSGAERDLRALADTGGFVVALDAGRTWFRFHRLFADLLAVQLRYTEPDEVPRLNGVAARWYAENGYAVEAISHADAAGDHQFAAGLLIENYFTLTLNGHQATARSLLEKLAPDPTAVDAPEVLAVIAADELVDGSLEQANIYLALAERNAEEVPPDRRQRFELALLSTRLSLARRVGDFRSVLADVQPGAGIEAPLSSRDIFLHRDVRALTLMNLGIVEVWSGRLEEGARHLEEAGALAEQIGRPYLQVSCLVHWAHATSWHSFTRARAATEEALELAESLGWGGDPVICPALIMLGGALVQAGRLDEAEECLARADVTLRPDLEPLLGFLRHMAYGVLYHARGLNTRAVASYRDAERLGLLLVTGSPLTFQLRCWLLSAMIGAGEMASVVGALSEMTETERAKGEAREVAASLALAHGDAENAIETLAPTLDLSAVSHHVLVVVRSHLLDALARDFLGDAQRAEAAIESALELAEEDALISPFLHVSCTALLERHPRHRTAHAAFLAEILDVIFDATNLPRVPSLAADLDELSEAELRVLRFLPTNLSATSIAKQIYVSANTVKTHMRHIYVKLDAHTRVDAVKRARELGLLSHSGRRE